MRPRRPPKKPTPFQQTPKINPHAVGLGALCALLVASPLIPSESVAETGAGLFLIMLWLLLFLGWGAAAALRGGRLRVDGVLVAAAALSACVAASGWMTAWEGNPRATINSVWQWVAFAVAFFLMRQLVVAPQERRAVCAAMIGLAVALSVFGFYQYLVALPATRIQFMENPMQAYRDAGLGANPDPQVAKLFYERVMSREPIATFALTNSLAGFLAPWLVVTAGLGLSAARERGALRWRALAAVAIALTLLAGCLLLTKSRTAWVATLFGLALTGFFAWRGAGPIDWRILLGLIAGGLTVFAAVAYLGGIDVKVVSEGAKSLLYRLEYWQASAEMIRDHPWWGVGVGNFQNYYTAHKLPQASEIIADPHNFLLEIWATAGAPALLALAAVFGAMGWRLAAPKPALHSEDSTRGLDAKAQSDAPHEAASVYPVYAGAVGGVLLGFPLALAAGFPVHPIVVLACLPGAACVALLHRWVRNGRLPVILPITAVAVMLVNFLAAGGIGFASVVTSLWLLAALALGEGERWRPVRILPASWSHVAAVAAAVLTAAFYFTAYRPTLAAKAAMDRAETARDAGRMEEVEAELRAATQADPYAPQPWQNLATLYAHRWIETGSRQFLDAFEHAGREAVRRNRRSFGLWRSIGDLYSEGYARRPDQKILQSSLAAYRQAVSLYPTHAGLRAQLAWRLHLSGEDAAAARQAAWALRLDRRNPHSEQKLARFAAPQGSGGDNLEHLAAKLRKLVESK